jgi:hypothetical protein
MSDLRDFRIDLTAVVRRFGILNLVETGCGVDSSGLFVAEKFGLRGWSCDVDEECVAAARQKYDGVVNGVCASRMGSVEFLQSIVHGPAFLGPTFFWLDAHFPGNSSDGPMWPLWDELQVLRGRCGDVIWCDDMQHVLGENPARGTQRVGIDLPDGGEWPGDSRHTIAEYMQCFAETHLAEIVDTVLRFTPRSLT